MHANNSNNVKVSIVIPVYNSEKFLKETLDSVIEQTYTNWEIVAVDDHSSDSSVEILRNYAKTDSRIKFHIRDSERKGGSVCRNIGLAGAVGEYIVFLDSDDLLRPFCLEQRVELMNKQKVCFAVFPMHSFETTKDVSKLVTQLDRKEHLLHFIAANCIWSTHCVIWKKDTLVSLGGFNEKYPRLQDPELHFRALLLNISYSVNADVPFDCYYRIVNKTRSQIHLHNTLLAYTMYLDDIFSCDKIEHISLTSQFNTAIKVLTIMFCYCYWITDAPPPFAGQIFYKTNKRFLYYSLKIIKIVKLNKVGVVNKIFNIILWHCYYKEVNKIP